MPHIFAYISLIVCGLAMIWTIITLFRNNVVFHYRVYLIGRIYERSVEDVQQSKNAQWRWKVFDAVGYDEMVMKFWKPLDSFYPDKSFIE